MRRIQKLTLGIAFVCAAHAGIVFNNISTSESIGNRAVSTTGQYQSFSNGPSGFSLTDFQVLLFGNHSSGSLSVDLYADSSTSPGALIDHIGSLSDNSLPFSVGLIFDFPIAPFALSAGTRYWIGLTSSSSTANWLIEGPYLGHPSDIGVTGEFIKDTLLPVMSDNSEAFQMTVTTQATQPPVTGAPEPASFVLGALGLLILTRRRRC